MSYIGPERRIHRVYITRNSEYHFRRDECVGVRDRRSGHWQHDHDAVGRRMAGAIRLHNGGGMEVIRGAPEVGERLCFDGDFLMTTPVETVARPACEDVRRYPVARAS